VAPNNELVVAGRFTSVDGVLANNVARWNGAAWQPMGAGVALGAAGACEALLVLANGEILAGGGGVQRWNGVSWSPLGSLGNVGSLVQMPNGDVVAAGTLVLPGGQHLARWDGTSWSSFGTSPDGGLSRLKVAQNGDLLVVGGFVSVGGQPIAGIARYDGVTWQGLGGGMFNPVDCVEELPNGDLVAGGRFVAAGGAPGAGGTPADQVARWNGTSWLPMGTGLAAITPNSLGPVRTLLALPGGELVAGGDFQPGGGNAGMNRVARWNGASWSSLRPGTAGAVLSTVETSSGQRYAVGSFAVIEGVVASRVAVRTNGVWQPLGSGANNTVHAVLPLPNGDLVIGGAFTEAGGVPCNRVALWDGSSWSALGAGLPATVRSLAVDAQVRRQLDRHHEIAAIVDVLRTVVRATHAEHLPAEFVRVSRDLAVARARGAADHEARDLVVLVDRGRRRRDVARARCPEILDLHRVEVESPACERPVDDDAAVVDILRVEQPRCAKARDGRPHAEERGEPVGAVRGVADDVAEVVERRGVADRLDRKSGV
jgi:hypothetical protein